MLIAFSAVAALAIIAAPSQATSTDDAPAALSAAATPAAVDPQSLELARRFIALSSPSELLEKQMIDQFKGMILMVPGVQAPQGSEAANELDRILAAAGPAIRRHGPGLADAYAQAYARAYSAEELRQLVAFAESPAGKRLFAHGTEIELDPGVTAAGQAMMMEAFTDFEHERHVAACKQATAKRVAAGDTKAKCPMA